MKTSLFSLIITVSFMETMAQNPFVGSYMGSINGDKATLTLQSKAANQLVGKLKDSQQTYEVNAVSNGTTIEGTAVEKTWNLTFNFNGELRGSLLALDMTIVVLGQKQSIHVDFIKEGSPTAPTSTPQYAAPKIPAGGKIDPNVVGKWVNEQVYNSGSGSNFFGGTSTQSLIFFSDGGLSDGGSSATISGSNYSGSSSGGGQATPLPNVRWYVQNQHIFIIATENGQTQTVDLGKYYIENGAMLITGNNGKKLLLQKRQ
ncbi:MAG: hypothetical protein JNL70_25115 [Saprospiraceae bacterium]|nr:hypothetical protein [Saprospiraceae bacterium]